MRFDDIDKVYVISLIGSERKERIKEELNAHGIYFEFWDGVKMEDGAEGLKETFYRIFKNSVMKGFNKILIIEDDAMFVNGLLVYGKKEIDLVLQDLPDDFSICKFGANLLLPVSKLTNNINKLRMSYALHACLYSRKAMITLLGNKAKEPIDVIVAKVLEGIGDCYVSSKMLMTQRPYKSNIFVYDETKHKNLDFYEHETGIIRWDIFMEKQWERNTKNIL